MKKKSFLVTLVALAFLAGAISIPVARADSVPDAGMELVQYFIDMFENDWSIGSYYDMSADGYGYAQSTSIPGSPAFTPYKRDPLDVQASMNLTPIQSPSTSEDGIIDLISRANETLYIEQMYIYETLNDLLLEIIDAKDRGVDVRVIQDDGTYDHNDASATILEAHGIPVRRLVEQPSSGAPFDMLHNKGVIVDGELVLVSSINWSPTSLRNNRETGVIIESSSVAAYYEDLFTYDWARAVDFVPTGSRADPVPESSHYFSPTTYSGYTNVTCLAAPDNCFDVINSLLLGAHESILISTYTLSSSFLLDTIGQKVGDGLDVRLMLEKSPVSTDEQNYNRWSMANLTAIGVMKPSGTYYYANGKWASSTFDYQHCKYAIIDGETLIISSGNWAQSSCPKPQADGDVDGNRDWWFVVKGAMIDVEETPGMDPVLLMLALTTSAIASSLYVHKKLKW
nr:phospholipase D-like domain-containing protein [Candidatus Sigynarchaeota archaeon]